MVLVLDQLVPFNDETIGGGWQAGQRRARRRRTAKRIRKKHFVPAEAFDVTIGCFAADASFRAAALVAIDTFNPNASPAALTYLETCAADAVTFQELRTVGDRSLAIQRAAKRSKWALSCGNATVTEAEGISSGVGVAVRSHIGLAHPPVAVPGTLEARFHLRWVGALVHGGFHLGSVYPRHSEGCSRLNLNFLQEVGGVLRRVCGQWIIGGDWNMAPETLQASGWLELVKGVIHRPCAATCKSSEYDYFVSSRGISNAVEGVAIVADGGCKPHSPSQLFLRRSAKNLSVKVLLAPTKIAASLPAGCAPDVGLRCHDGEDPFQQAVSLGDADGALGPFVAPG